jgi:hypothetical protein
VPNFDDNTLRSELSNVSAYENKLAVTRMIVRQLREELKATHHYKWSKLELMDDYKVKESELSAWPMYLTHWHESIGPLRKKKQVKKPKTQKVPVADTKASPENVRHSSRIRKEAKKDKDFEY